MTPNERADWCIQQAEEIESGLQHTDGELDLMPIGYAFARWYRDMAARLMGAEAERAA